MFLASILGTSGVLRKAPDKQRYCELAVENLHQIRCRGIRLAFLLSWIYTWLWRFPLAAKGNQFLIAGSLLKWSKMRGVRSEIEAKNRWVLAFA